MTLVDEARELTRIKLRFFRRRNGHCAIGPTCGGWAAYGWHPKIKRSASGDGTSYWRLPARPSLLGWTAQHPMLLLIRMTRVRACARGHAALNRTLTWATRMAWKYSYKPPSGIPAKGASFMGWGGPPKGAGRGGPRRSFAKGHTQGFVRGKPETFVYHSRLGDPVKMAEAKKLAAAKAEREEQLIQRLGDIALNSENEMAAIAACNGALDRIDGKPVTRTRNQSRTTTLEEMILEAAKRGEKPTG